jgi:hypothetical protein
MRARAKCDGKVYGLPVLRPTPILQRELLGGEAHLPTLTDPPTNLTLLLAINPPSRIGVPRNRARNLLVASNSSWQAARTVFASRSSYRKSPSRNWLCDTAFWRKENETRRSKPEDSALT